MSLLKYEIKYLNTITLILCTYYGIISFEKKLLEKA